MHKSKKQILASVGLPATAAGEKKFYEMFPTEDSYHQHMAMGGMAKFGPGGEGDGTIPFVTSIPAGFVPSKDKPGTYEKTTTFPGNVKPGNVKPVDPEKRTKDPQVYQNMMIDMVKSGKKSVEDLIQSGAITQDFAKTLAPYSKKEYVQLQQPVTQPAKTNMPLKDSDIINRKQIWTPGNQNQFYDTFLYPDVNAGYSQSTTRYFDKKTGQEVNPSKSFDEKGNYIANFIQGDPNTVAGTVKATRYNTPIGSPTDNPIENTLSSGFKFGGFPDFVNPPVLLFGMGGAPCYECGGPHMQKGGLTSKEQSDSTFIANQIIQDYKDSGIGDDPYDRLQSGFYGMNEFMRDPKNRFNKGYNEGYRGGKDYISKNIILSNDQVVSLADYMKNPRGPFPEDNFSNAQKIYNSLSKYDKERVDKAINYKKEGGGLSRGEDYGSKKKPYPSVDSSDFAGGGRSYPIPTRADAVDALRLAGLHGRADVRAKVFAKYPDLKKEMGGSFVDDGSYPSMLDGGFFSYMAYGGDPSLANITQGDFMKMFKGLVKKEEGGSTTPGQTDQSYLDKKNNTFMSSVKNYTQDAIMKQAGEELYNEFLQTGGNFFGRMENPMSNLYKMRTDQLNAGAKGALTNFAGATQNMFETANPYMTVAAEGIQVLTNPATGKPYSQEEYNELTKYFGKGSEGSYKHPQQEQHKDQEWYDKPYGQGMTYFPMNYHPFIKFNKEGKAAMEQLANNPTSNITKFKTNRFGPWGKTVIEFGYKPQHQQIQTKGYVQPQVTSPEASGTSEEEVVPKMSIGEQKKFAAGMAYGGDFYLPKHQDVGITGYDPYSFQGAPAYQAPKNPYAVDPIYTTQMQGENKTVTPAQGSGKLLTDYDQTQDRQGKLTMKYRPGFQPEAMANWAMAGMSGISSLMEQAEALKNQKKYMESLAADNQFYAVQGDRGFRNQWGKDAVDRQVPVQFQGYNTGTPQLGTYPSKFGGMKGYLETGGYAEGGEYYLTESEIEALQKMGGEIEYLD